MAKAIKLEVGEVRELKRLLESFFYSMRSDVYHGKRLSDEQQAKAMVKSYIPFYNGQPLHSSLNYVSPKTYEKMFNQIGVYLIVGRSRSRLRPLLSSALTL